MLDSTWYGTPFTQAEALRGLSPEKGEESRPGYFDSLPSRNLQKQINGGSFTHNGSSRLPTLLTLSRRRLSPSVRSVRSAPVRGMKPQLSKPRLV